MIVFIIVLVIFAVFAGFNLEGIKISVGFHEFENVPTFLALLIAFVFGTLVMLPFSIRGLKRKKEKQALPEEPPLDVTELEDTEESPEAKKPRGKKSRKS